eukprot:364939-Chlamydomonas_euryale.AAC.9
MWAATGLRDTARVCRRVRCRARYAVDVLECAKVETCQVRPHPAAHRGADPAPDEPILGLIVV